MTAPPHEHHLKEFNTWIVADSHLKAAFVNYITAYEIRGKVRTQVAWGCYYNGWCAARQRARVELKGN